MAIGLASQQETAAGRTKRLWGTLEYWSLKLLDAKDRRDLTAYLEAAEEAQRAGLVLRDHLSRPSKT